MEKTLSREEYDSWREFVQERGITVLATSTDDAELHRVYVGVYAYSDEFVPPNITVGILKRLLAHINSMRATHVIYPKYIKELDEYSTTLSASLLFLGDL